jgi:hypothetical protein
MFCNSSPEVRRITGMLPGELILSLSFDFAFWYGYSDHCASWLALIGLFCYPKHIAARFATAGYTVLVCVT